MSFATNFLSLTATKRLSVNSFYVKDTSVWLPHMVVPNCVPTCYCCCAKAGVDVGRFRWVKHPKVLHGVKTHRYLDSVCHWCTPCNQEFLAWDEAVLESDADEITGILNFRLSNGFAVDEELYSFVVTHGTDTTTLAHERLKALHSDHWVHHATICHRAGLAKRVKPIPKRGRIEKMLTNKPESAAQKRRKTLRWEHMVLHRKVVSAQTSFDADINFKSIIHRKENRNTIGETLPGIGKAKCQTLVSRGINTAKELLLCEGGDPAIKCSWKAIFQQHCDDLESKLNHLKGKCDAALTELQLDVAINGDVSGAPDASTEDGASVTVISISGSN